MARGQNVFTHCSKHGFQMRNSTLAVTKYTPKVDGSNSVDYLGVSVAVGACTIFKVYIMLNRD